MAKLPKGADKFLSSEVVRWSKKDFLTHFGDRFENAGEIYDYFVPKKAKKSENKED